MSEMFNNSLSRRMKKTILATVIIMLVQEKMSLLVIMSASMTITARVVEIVRIAAVQVARTFLRMIIQTAAVTKLIRSQQLYPVQ